MVEYFLDSMRRLSICWLVPKMIDPTTLTASERCARLLLAAWNTGDLTGLEAALRQASAADRTGLTSSEEERMELVREIAGGIQMWLRGVRWERPADLTTHLELLRHLARCEAVAHEKGAAQQTATEHKHSAAREFPRLEMLVSGLN
jgi:hypothetical protein